MRHVREVECNARRRIISPCFEQCTLNAHSPRALLHEEPKIVLWKMLVGCFGICNVDYWVRAFRNDMGCESGILLLVPIYGTSSALFPLAN